jgi:hypothetical protein
MALLVGTFVIGGVLLHEPPGFYVLAAVVAVIGGYGGWRIASRALD